MKKILSVFIFGLASFILANVVNAAQLIPGAKIYDTGISAKSADNMVNGFVINQSYNNPRIPIIIYLVSNNYGYSANFPNPINPELTIPYSATLPPSGQWSGPIAYGTDINNACLFQFRQDPTNDEIVISVAPRGHITCSVAGTNLGILGYYNIRN